MKHEEIELALKEIISEEDRINWLKSELGLYWNNADILKALKDEGYQPGLKNYEIVDYTNEDWLKNQMKIGYAWYKNDKLQTEDKFTTDLNKIIKGN